MSTKAKYERIERLIDELAKSKEFDGLAIAVIAEPGDGLVYSTLRSRMHDLNTIAGLTTLIEDINRKNRGCNFNTSIVS